MIKSCNENIIERPLAGYGLINYRVNAVIDVCWYVVEPCKMNISMDSYCSLLVIANLQSRRWRRNTKIFPTSLTAPLTLGDRYPISLLP
jgi:hypothetical protein